MDEVNPSAHVWSAMQRIVILVNCALILVFCPVNCINFQLIWCSSERKRDTKNSFYLVTVHTVYLLIHIGHETGSREL